MAEMTDKAKETVKKRRVDPHKTVVVFILCLFLILSAILVAVYVNTHLFKQNTFDEQSFSVSHYEMENVHFQNEYKYFAVGNGKKYHVDGCPYVTEKSERVPVSQKQIDKGNYTACKRCIK